MDRRADSIRRVRCTIIAIEEYEWVDSAPLFNRWTRTKDYKITRTAGTRKYTEGHVWDYFSRFSCFLCFSFSFVSPFFSLSLFSCSPSLSQDARLTNIIDPFKQRAQLKTPVQRTKSEKQYLEWNNFLEYLVLSPERQNRLRTRNGAGARPGQGEKMRVNLRSCGMQKWPGCGVVFVVSRGGCLHLLSRSTLHRLCII